MRLRSMVARLLVALMLLAPERAHALSPSRVATAIVEAVRSRMGADAAVSVASLDVTGVRMDAAADASLLRAVPDPSARIGGRMSFRLLASAGRGEPPRSLGNAVAVVHVAVEHVRAVHLVTRGQELTADDLQSADDRLPSLPLRAVPRIADVSGVRALVNLAPGEVVTETSVAARPAVRSGQVVRATVRIEGLDLSAALVAAQNGRVGEVIRVVNRESRRSARARVTEPGVVEVMP